MAKTRSQAKNIAIKKEEEEDSKSTLMLASASNKTRNKITKRKPSRSRNRRLPAQQVKVEEDTDTKPLLQSASNHSKRAQAPSITQEQINRIIDAIVNDNMSIRQAAREAKVSSTSAGYYYSVYKNNPDKKIPSPRIRYMKNKPLYTQQHIKKLIGYIVDDKMSIRKASAKANMNYKSGGYYYKKYLQDPNHSIPIPYWNPYFTQDQINEFIGYIVNDKMNMSAASKKANMGFRSAMKHVREYFNDQHPDIPTPSHLRFRKLYTQKQKNEVIGYIVNDKMSLNAASKKANMSRQAATEYYRRYLKDHNIENPVPTSNQAHTQEKINEFIGYIVDDKMTMTAASKKANMNSNSGRKHYRRYLIDQGIDLPNSKYTQTQINEFMGYIADDKMTVYEASTKANVPYITGYDYYRKYLKDNNLDFPFQKRFTQDEIKNFVGYIVRDKMNIHAASRKANMDFKTGYRHYQMYLKNQKHDTPN